MGFEVHAVATGGEALAGARTLQPALVTVDLNLPDADGLDVSGDIRKICDAPMLFITARAEPDDEMAGIASGAAAYLTKPFRPRELTELIDRLCPAEPSRTGSRDTEPS